MRAGTSSRVLTISILLAFAMMALGQLNREQPPQGTSAQRPSSATNQNSGNSRQAADAANRNSAGQQGSSVQPDHGVQNPNNPTASRLAIRGCLMQGKEGYTLMQESTDTVFQLLGDQSQLSGAAGKVVEVHGRELEPLAASMNMPRLQINDVKVVADQCPVTSKVPLPNSAAPGGERNPEPDATPRYERDNPVQAPPAVPINPNTQGTTGAPSAGTGNPPPPAASQPPQGA